MITRERLAEYYEFDEQIVESVDRAAHDQNQYSFEVLADRYGLSSGPKVVLPHYYDKPIEVATLTPREDFNETEARVLHLPMANPISPSMMMRAMRLFESDPSKQLIVYGNLSGFNRAGRVPLGDSRVMYQTHTLLPLVRPTLQHLQDAGIKQVDHLGYSMGADKAAVAISDSYERQSVERGVLIEPAAVASRGLVRLAKDFARSNSELKRYWQQSKSQPYTELREKETALGLITWSAGLLRLTNLAVAKALSDDDFEPRVARALEAAQRSSEDANSDLKVAIGWGELSEVSSPEHMRQLTGRLQERYGEDKIKTMEFRDMHHAGGDDIDLHAAIMLQGLKLTK